MNEGTRSGKSTIRLLGISAERPTNGLYLTFTQWQIYAVILAIHDVILYIEKESKVFGATQPIVGVYFTALYRALASSHTRLMDHTQRRATVGRTPLDE
jgi:hypothetical protein